MSSPSDSAAFDGRPSGVIHDLGYRPYAGPRLGAGPVAWSFFRTGLRNTYGLGRSGRSKVLPMILLAMMLLPALILVGVLVQAQDVLDLDQQLVAYSRYPVITQALISVFVAAQAPALISRDLRFRTITLYLARPMQRSVYVLVRYASLTVATFILIGAPLVLMYAGGLLADLPVGRETRRLPGRHVRRGAARRPALRAGRRGGRADGPARPRGGRRDRGARGQLHRRVDDPGHRVRHRQRHASARSRGCSRRTPWSTASRSSSSTPRTPPSRRRTAPRWVCVYVAGRAAHRGRLGRRAPRPLPATVQP